MKDKWTLDVFKSGKCCKGGNTQIWPLQANKNTWKSSKKNTNVSENRPGLFSDSLYTKENPDKCTFMSLRFFLSSSLSGLQKVTFKKYTQTEVLFMCKAKILQICVKGLYSERSIQQPRSQRHWGSVLTTPDYGCWKEIWESNISPIEKNKINTKRMLKWLLMMYFFSTCWLTLW